MEFLVAAGISEHDAKEQLSQAIADRALHVRCRVGVGQGQLAGAITTEVEVPTHLTPESFDWTDSRPNGPWRFSRKGLARAWQRAMPVGFHCAGAYYDWKDKFRRDPGCRLFDLIEVSTGSMTEIWPNLATDAVRHPERLRPGRPAHKRERIKQELRTKLDQKRTTPVQLRAEKLIALAREHDASPETISRARAELLREYPTK